MNTPASNEPIKVLFVEDNLGDVRLVQEILKEASANQFDLTSVELVTEAVAELTDNSMDVILLDLTLPDAAGLESIKKMHNNALNLPIVVLIGHNHETLALQSLSEGAQDFLLKHNLNGDLLTRVLRYAVERKRADQMQRENEERFRALVQHSTDIITILAADGTVLYESPSLETVLGYRPEAVQGLNMAAFIHSDDLPPLLDGMQTLLDQPAMVFSRESRVRHDDGSWRTLEMTMTNLLDHPAIRGIVVNSHDVTERKRSEEALRFQAQLLNTVGQAVIATNLENQIIYWNRFAETLYGWSAAEAFGRSIVDLTPADTSREQVEAIMARLRAGESWQGEFTMQRRDGMLLPVLVTDTPILDENGALLGIIGVSLDISERKRAEEVQRESEARFKIIAERLPVGIVITRLSDGTVLHANEAYCDLIGVPVGTAVGQLTRFLLSDPDEEVKLAQQLQENGFVPVREVQIQRPDGILRWVLVAITMISLNGEAVLLSGFHDITPIKTLEREQAFLAAIVDSSEDAIIGKSPEGVILSWNRGAEQLYGYRPEEAIGQSIQMLAPPELPDEIPELLKQLSQGGYIAPFETMRMTKAGRRVEVSLAISPIQTRNGTIIGAATVAHDITERKRAERALQQYTRRLEVLHTIDRAILAAQPPQQIAETVAHTLADLLHCDRVRIIALDADDKTLTYVAAYPPASPASQALLRQTVENYGLPESFHRGKALLIDDIQTHQDLWVGFKEILTRENMRAWIGLPLIAGEQLVGILAAGSVQPHAFTTDHVEIAREIADQMAIALHKQHLDEQIEEHVRRLEGRVTERTEQLASAKERSDAILMSASHAMIVAAPDGSIGQVNTAFTALFGHTLEPGRAPSLFELVDAVSADTLRRTLEEMVECRQSKRVELIGVRQDGTLFDAEVACSCIEGGGSNTLICSFLDITERKQAEAVLRKAWAKEKELNELKTHFVSMVSHDFRTPLASIQSSSDLLNHYSARMTDAKKAQHFSTIDRQIKHLTGLLEDMLTLTKAESVGLPFHPTATDLGVFCQGLVDEMQPLAGTRAIKLVVDGQVDAVEIDPNLLRRALINLLSNAVKYSPEGSLIELHTAREMEQIVLRIQDHGIGIPEEEQARLFELFHRANNVGDIPGTGLGLAIVKLAVEAHGGTITVDSHVNVGTTFTVSLPLMRAERATK